MQSSLRRRVFSVLASALEAGASIPRSTLTSSLCSVAEGFVGVSMSMIQSLKGCRVSVVACTLKAIGLRDESSQGEDDSPSIPFSEWGDSRTLGCEFSCTSLEIAVSNCIGLLHEVYVVRKRLHCNVIELVKPSAVLPCWARQCHKLLGVLITCWPRSSATTGNLLWVSDGP